MQAINFIFAPHLIQEVKYFRKDFPAFSKEKVASIFAIESQRGGLAPDDTSPSPQGTENGVQKVSPKSRAI